ncbi:uncharacterized protein LOC143183915 isoform X9 [Calliopsis andreniformis]|uniref:uncharacterized protein LOC143183915 isoform X9 n=1 Tax=Calliopsis andreniformis TaxID=337506 RepID=UPI003FCC3A23
MLFEYHSACMRDVSTHRVLVTEHVIRVLGLGNCNIHNEIPSFALKYLNTVYDKPQERNVWLVYIRLYLQTNRRLYQR